MNSFYLLLLLVSPTLALHLDEPLILTPLLKQGKYQEAQDKSLVPSLIPGLPNSGYSGFFQIDEIAKTNLFFWFHPKENAPNWKDAPIILFLMGDFGLSSLRGAFQESLFPYNFTQEGIVGRFDLALTRFANVLIIDNTNIGFSHTSDQSRLLYSLDHIVEEYYSVLEQFFFLFPDVKRSVFLSGISVGGTKAVSLGNMILKRDRKVVDLEGIILGDSFTDVEGDYSRIGDFYFSFGLIEKKRARKIDDVLGKMDAHNKANDFKAVKNIAGGDLRTKCINNPTGKGEDHYYSSVITGRKNPDKWTDFVQSPDVRNKLHVGNLKLAREFTLWNTLNYDDIYRKQNVGFILNHKIPYLKFHGQYDGIITYQGTIESLRAMNWYGQKYFETNIFRRQQIWISGKLFGYLRKCLHVWEVFF